MAVVAEQLGRRLDGQSGELIFLVTGTESADSARAAMLASPDAPAALGGLERDDDGSGVDEYEGVSGGAYLGRVRYRKAGKPRPPVYNTGESVYGFDISGVPTRILSSRATISKVAAGGGTPPDFKGAINVQDAHVEGTDIIVPEASFTETHFIANASMTAAYQRTIASLVGCFNDASFKGYLGGEVLFIGASGTRRGRDDWEVTFRFSVQFNAASLPVGGGAITVTNKLGWDYLWVFYERDEENLTEKGNPIPQPTAAYVERVYREGDLSLLGIGT